MKRAYITPTMETVELSYRNVLASESVPVSDDTIENNDDLGGNDFNRSKEYGDCWGWNCDEDGE